MAANIDGLRINTTGEIVSPSVGSSALKSSVADDTGITVNASSGALEIKTAGTSLSNGVQRDELSKYAGARIKGDLTASDSAAGVVSIQNTYGTDLVVERLFLKIDTASSGACTVNAGVASTAASASDLLSGASVASTGIVDNHTAPALSSVLWPSTYYLTVSVASGASSGLVGTYQAIVSDMN